MGQGRATSMTQMSASKEKRWSLMVCIRIGRLTWCRAPGTITSPPKNSPPQLQSDLVHAQVHVGLNGGALCDSKEACLDRCDRDHNGVSFFYRGYARVSS